MKRTFNKAWCMFEQSGTFKNEFIKLGIPAVDLDIQNNFGETDYVIDLFVEIEKEYDNLTRGGQNDTIFSDIDPEKDLIMAFFPCIYFCAMSQTAFFMSNTNYRCMTDLEKIQAILERDEKRKYFYETLIKFVYICLALKIRMVFENPWAEQTYLKANFLKVPDIIDTNRMRRGDYFNKPTAYWFWNFEPTYGESYQNDKEQKIINQMRGGKQAGICSEERSMISSDYARNFICDFILGKVQDRCQQSLFE